MPGFSVLHHLLALAQTRVSTEAVMPPNHLALCCPIRLLPSIFPSVRVFSYESSDGGVEKEQIIHDGVVGLSGPTASRARRPFCKR